MVKHGYCRSQYDSCVYYKTFASGSGIYLLLYFYDMLITCEQREENRELKI